MVPWMAQNKANHLLSEKPDKTTKADINQRLDQVDQAILTHFFANLVLFSMLFSLYDVMVGSN